MSYLWSLFIIIILFLLIYDLSFFSNDNTSSSFKRSLFLSVFYITIAIMFGFGVGASLGKNKMIEYFTGFVVEKSLSLDNIFVISLVFKNLNIPLNRQHKVLFWGILGALVLRGGLIFVGCAAIAKFTFLMSILGIFLIFTGIKILVKGEEKFNVEKNIFFKFFKKYFNITLDETSGNFFIRKNKKIYPTSLFIALVIVEGMDIVFALDSIPAIFAITKDIFIIYSSNIFAILGLRALYFCLENAVKKFQYLKYSIATILIFIGVKIFIKDIPIAVSLIIIFSIIFLGIIFSFIKK